MPRYIIPSYLKNNKLFNKYLNATDKNNIDLSDTYTGRQLNRDKNLWIDNLNKIVNDKLE
jgi:hypothetical protein